MEKTYHDGLSDALKIVLDLEKKSKAGDPYNKSGSLTGLQVVSDKLRGKIIEHLEVK